MKNKFLKNIHIINKDPGERIMRKLVIEYGYIWEGYSKDIRIYLKYCPICNNTHKRNNIKMPIKQILDEGTHFRYEDDLWYLDDAIKKDTNYNYCLDISEHFPKMLGSYLLNDKTMEIIISKIKYHILLYGKCKILQCDNGTEYKNRELKVFTEN